MSPKAKCQRCDFTKNTPYDNEKCPRCGSFLLQLPLWINGKIGFL